MVNVKKIREGLFCITWMKVYEGPSSSQVKVRPTEVFKSCQLTTYVRTHYAKGCYREVTLEMEIVFSKAILNSYNLEEIRILASEGIHGLQKMMTQKELTSGENAKLKPKLGLHFFLLMRNYVQIEMRSFLKL